MTVEEFINKLSKYPRDVNITINNNWDKEILNITYYPNLKTINITHGN